MEAKKKEYHCKIGKERLEKHLEKRSRGMEIRNIRWHTEYCLWDLLGKLKDYDMRLVLTVLREVLLKVK